MVDNRFEHAVRRSRQFRFIGRLLLKPPIQLRMKCRCLILSGLTFPLHSPETIPPIEFTNSFAKLLHRLFGIEQKKSHFAQANCVLQNSLYLKFLVSNSA